MQKDKIDTLLAPLAAPLTSLRGVGPQIAPLLERAVGGASVRDLLFHLPESYIDRTSRPTIKEAKPGQVVTLAVDVVRHEKPANRRQPFKVTVTDGTGFLDVVFFNPRGAERLPVGGKVIISGKLDAFGVGKTMPHPDHVVPLSAEASLPVIEPVWPLTAGLFAGHVRRAMAAALERIPELPEWHDPALVRREKWPSFAEALRLIHTPVAPPPKAARKRLAYDELLAHQFAMAWARARSRERPGRPFGGSGELRRTALARFGHPLTQAQVKALREIDTDLSAPRRMLRLLQGDVGAGKTIVALLSMLHVAETGAQAAMMAPTELLARQHHRTLSASSPLPVGILTGSMSAAERRPVLRGLASGDLKLVVGTHALFQEGVEYRDLGLAVIDEQHRFGVDQRMSLGAKGTATDVLVMTATPIPRTLLLTQWGEMEVSRLDQKPAGRQPIRTTLHSLSTLDEIVAGIGRALREGAQIYWVCPLVAESEEIDLAAAEERYRDLHAHFGAAVGLAHGQQEFAVREAALADFVAGKTKLLVATTVIEVGVDVPQATIMVIEHAERFGLAQLHQLRGRVGRGAAKSFCLLLHADGLGDYAKRRLTLLRDTEDGFRIADEDFRLRGGGDGLGTRQSGMPGYRLAIADEDEELLATAHQEAALILHRDPALESPRAEVLKVLLRLFERGDAVRTLRAG